MRDFDEPVRLRVARAARAMARSGLNHGTSGNVSGRLEDPGTFVVTPTAVPCAKIAPARLPRMTLEGAWIDGEEPSTEWRVHGAIYSARPEVRGIVHAHPLHASSVACLRLDIPAFHAAVPMLGGADVRCAAYATHGSEELARAAVEALRDRKACLLANHGIVAVGESVEAALKWAEELEFLAAMFLAARSAGTPVLLTATEVSDALGEFREYGRGNRVGRPLRE
jgi:L-fuculose-phosphate aldolase